MNFGESSIYKSTAALLPLIAISCTYDIIKFFTVKMSCYTGYNLLSEVSATSTYLPSIYQLGLLGNMRQCNSSFNYTWGGVLALLAFLFIGGLLAGGYLGTAKDMLRGRYPKLKVFVQFSWYYGPRLFLLAIIRAVSFKIAIALGLKPLGYIMGLLFYLAPLLMVLEDIGIIEGLLAAPLSLWEQGVYSVKLLSYGLVAAYLATAVGSLPFSGGRVAAIVLWHFAYAYIAMNAVEHFSATIIDVPLSKQPREHLRGYGMTIYKMAILTLAIITMLGLPQTLSKHKYFQTLLPWHRPLLTMEGYIYKTQGTLVYSRQNSLKKARVLIDSVNPSLEEIARVEPGMIKGKGRILSESKDIYFSFELMGSSSEGSMVYSLQNGGKIEAFDGLWGKPLDRGAVLAITPEFDNISGVFYDKDDCAGINSLWDGENKAVFLGPMDNKPELFGFYADGNHQRCPVEFQWLYNSVIPETPQGENTPLFIMEKLNNAFETLDLDFLLNELYYVKDLRPEGLLTYLKESFREIKRERVAQGLEDWEDTVVSDFSYYPITDIKMGIVGDYSFSEVRSISFRAEVYRIGAKWMLTRVEIDLTDNDQGQAHYKNPSSLLVLKQFV